MSDQSLSADTQAPAGQPVFAPPAPEMPMSGSTALTAPAPQAGTPVAVPAAQGTFCRACGNSLDPRAAICPGCGVATGVTQGPQFNPAALADRKSGGVAILLSLLITGLGHVYAGNAGRGAAFFGAAVLAAFSVLLVIGFVALPVIWIWAAFDANKTAERHNLRLLGANPQVI